MVVLLEADSEVVNWPISARVDLVRSSRALRSSGLGGAMFAKWVRIELCRVFWEPKVFCTFRFLVS